MAGPQDDRALAAAVVRGEAGAAEALFDRVFDRLYRRVCARLGGDHHAAEDIVSESLLAGLRALPGFRGEGSLAGWFLRIAWRKIADRTRGRRATERPWGGDGDLDGLVADLRAASAGPLERLAEEETRGIVREALESLPFRYEIVLRWRYFEDASVGQVALRLNVSAKAAERRLARARAALASALRRRGVRE